MPGATVFLSVGSAGRIPRRYRGRDIFRWMHAIVTQGPPIGVTLPTVDTLPDPSMRLAATRTCPGMAAGMTPTCARSRPSGRMTLLGRITGVTGERLDLADDLPAKLAFADTFFGERFQPLIEALIAAQGSMRRPTTVSQSTHDPPVPRTLDLAGCRHFERAVDDRLPP